MQVRTDLRCADRLVEADEAYVFPKKPFVLQTPIGQMTLKEISMLPGARESVRAYAETAQQFMELFLANADDFISRNKISLVKMEQAIASNAAEVQEALNRAQSRAAAGNMKSAEAEPETGTEENTGPDTAGGSEAEAGTDMNMGTEAGSEAESIFDSSSESAQEAALEKHPDDIPGEGFYELLYDLDEMMKLGII